MAFAAVIAALVDAVPPAMRQREVSLLLYGSVATGAAQRPTSDVDAFVVGASSAWAAATTGDLSRRFAAVCRGVEVGAAQPEDHVGDSDEAYGNRVFLRHYCLTLAGPNLTRSWAAFPADAQAARGLNGDIEASLQRWRRALAGLAPAGADDMCRLRLARRVARKTLLAVAGLVSVRHGGWTTDRGGAARRWSQQDPTIAKDVEQLLAWSQSLQRVEHPDLQRALDDQAVVSRVVERFRAEIGLWR